MDILLIHGAFHDENCWDQLLPHLKENGFNVHRISLPGHKYSSPNIAFGINMHTYANEVCKKAKQIGKPIVLLGHSMSGFVISLAGEMMPEMFSNIIYLCAFVPQRKDKLKYITKKYRHEPFQKMLKFPISYLLKGCMFLNKEMASEIFYNGIDRRNQNYCALLRPQPLFPYFSNIEWSEKKLGTVRKHYIECLYDNAIPIGHQREMQLNMDFSNNYVLKSNHSPFLHKPHELANAIKKMVN